MCLLYHMPIGSIATNVSFFFSWNSNAIPEKDIQEMNSGPNSIAIYKSQFKMEYLSN